jgi:GxxExxY protein
MEILFREESYKIIGACFIVHRKLGTGFLESVYLALIINFGNSSLKYKRIVN